MKLIRLAPKGIPVKARMEHVLVCILMGLDCLIGILSLGSLDSILAAPLISKRRERMKAQEDACIKEIQKKLAEQIKALFESREPKSEQDCDSIDSGIAWCDGLLEKHAKKMDN